MKFSEDDFYSDLFVDGPADMAIIQSTYLTDFYKTGLSKIERSHAMAARHPERFIINGTFDPRDGEKARRREGAGIHPLDEGNLRYLRHQVVQCRMER